MKTLFTLSLLTLAVFNHATAQIKKGEKMLGGNIAIATNNAKYSSNLLVSDNTNKSVSIALSTQLGFGAGNNWVFGPTAGYTFSSQESQNDNRNRQYQLTVGVFGRKFHPIGDKFGIFGQADASYGFGAYKYRQGGVTQTQNRVNAYSLSVKPGAFYKLNKKIIIEATMGNIGFSHTVSRSKQNNDKNTFNQGYFLLSSSLGLGVQFVL